MTFTALYLARQINQARLSLNKIFGEDGWNLNLLFKQELKEAIMFIDYCTTEDLQKFIPENCYSLPKKETETQTIVSKKFYLQQIPDPMVRKYIEINIPQLIQKHLNF